jgi:hypothetical protein
MKIPLQDEERKKVIERIIETPPTFLKKKMETNQYEIFPLPNATPKTQHIKNLTLSKITRIPLRPSILVVTETGPLPSSCSPTATFISPY